MYRNMHSSQTFGVAKLEIRIRTRNPEHNQKNTTKKSEDFIHLPMTNNKNSISVRVQWPVSYMEYLR